jgi:hypothetical protein
MICKRATVVLSVLFVMFSFCPGAFSGDQDNYRNLLSRLKGGDRSVDLQALRLAYTKTADYKPYGDNDREIRTAMFAALKEKKYDESISQAEKILAHNYVDLDSHYVCRAAYRGLKNRERFEFHDFMFMGFVKSIMAEGDASSPEKAGIVINTAEEYVILGIFGLKSKKQGLVSHNGKSYDKVDVVDPKTGKEFSIYFDIDIPYNWLTKNLQKK